MLSIEPEAQVISPHIVVMVVTNSGGQASTEAFELNYRGKITTKRQGLGRQKAQEDCFAHCWL